jgi:hypothetical protein
MEEHLACRLVQVGSHYQPSPTLANHQIRRGSCHHAKPRSLSSLKFEGSLFISLDLDVLDPAFAPGISHYEPGGMSVREVLGCLQGLKVPVVGADIVEYNPTRDLHGQTAMVCAESLKEIAAAMLRQYNVPPQRLALDWSVLRELTLWTLTVKVQLPFTDPAPEALPE